MSITRFRMSQVIGLLGLSAEIQSRILTGESLTAVHDESTLTAAGDWLIRCRQRAHR